VENKSPTRRTCTRSY